MKRLMFSTEFEKYSNIKFHENPSSWSRLAPCGLSEEITQLIVPFSNFSNAPKIDKVPFHVQFVTRLMK